VTEFATVPRTGSFRGETMKIIVYSNHNIALTEEAIGGMEATATTALKDFDTHLTRLQVNLSDGSAGRNTGDDIRCRLAAHLEGRNSEFALDNASTVDKALSGALQKLHDRLERTLGRFEHHTGGSSMDGVEPS
jgi:hypothetical protein